MELTSKLLVDVQGNVKKISGLNKIYKFRVNLIHIGFMCFCYLKIIQFSV